MFKKATLILSGCDRCPYKGMSWAGYPKCEHEGRYKNRIIPTTNGRIHVIPDWCPLLDVDIEKKGSKK